MSDNSKGNSFLALLKYRFNLDDDKAEESEIIESIRKNILFKGTNLWTLIFAILIASIGLNVNSTAVVIGAMLISPLMGPVMGIGLGIGIFDFELIKRALKNLLIAVTISLITSTLYFSITPLHVAQSELLARTTPTIWDVLIAIAGGLAGIVASSRKHISNVIPGVAIATALMPPLCTAGYGLGNGNFYYFIGAFYLFLINCVFISITTFLIVRFLKFQPVHYVNKAVETKVRKYIWTIAIFTILPSIFLAYKFVQNEVFEQRVQNFITQEIRSKNLFVIDKNIDLSNKSLTLFIYGDEMTDSLSKDLISRKKMYGLEKSEIKIRKTLDSNRKIVDPTFTISENTRLEQELIEKEAKIQALSSKIRIQQQNAANDTAIYNEFTALFGKPKELMITNTPLFRDSTRDTVTFVYYSMPKPLTKNNKTQAENWLKERTKARNLKIVTK
ncbi:MAG TPA: TIGR00341 family protein [Bacteroidia bacterium]|nr:TIGR00341 family protein [Bacteroidia bacterium]